LGENIEIEKFRVYGSETAKGRKGYDGYPYFDLFFFCLNVLPEKEMFE